ncbi:MAG: Hsp20/alpha crystallin family protein [Acidobacteria bacterium]|jgi:HSP20 family protein|nr:Hsp20/alpha crystallin family protein [Acidobacteriota bacterium]
MAKKNFPYFEVEITKNYPSGISTHIDWKPSTNIVETHDSLVIEMELPGVAKEDVAITLLNNQELIVKGVKKQPRPERGPVTYYLFEREFGTFYKKIVIDFPLDTSQVTSLMENGVLILEVRKRGESKIAVEIK